MKRWRTEIFISHPPEQTQPVWVYQRGKHTHTHSQTKKYTKSAHNKQQQWITIKIIIIIGKKAHDVVCQTNKSTLGLLRRFDNRKTHKHVHMKYTAAMGV